MDNFDDLDDDNLPGDDAPPEVENFKVADPDSLPKDEGNADAALKEAE